MVALAKPLGPGRTRSREGLASAVSRYDAALARLNEADLTWLGCPGSDTAGRLDRANRRFVNAMEALAAILAIIPGESIRYDDRAYRIESGPFVEKYPIVVREDDHQ